MSFSSVGSQRLTLIENPKSRKDWDNNKLYYQQKFFSKKQKDVLKETERKQEIALKHISTRQPHVSGVDGGYSSSKKTKESDWKYRAESISIFQKQMRKNENWNDDCIVSCETSSIVEKTNDVDVECNNTKNENQSTVQIIMSTNVDDWEDLC
jgi:hypothetical protein